MTNPISDEILTDPEGLRLVQAIHDRKAQHEELGRIIWVTSHRDEGTISATGANIVADAILAAGYRKPRTVTTLDELDELPVGSVILDSVGLSLHKNPFTGWCASNGAKEIGPEMLESDALPATVLHDPEATK